MPRRPLPTAFRSSRPLRLLGTAYAAGATVPLSVVRSIRNLSGLVERRWLLPNVDTNQRRSLLSRPGPMDLGVGERRALQ